MREISRTKAAIGAGALVLAGFGGGAAVMLATSASAEDSAVSALAGGPGRGGAGEEPLTGNTLEQVTDAVEERYPNATIERAETDSEGVYEAHIVTGGGERLIVQLDEDFAITGTQSGDFGGHRGPGCDGPDDGSTDGSTDGADAPNA